jgi:predicted enzyme related to lactoylglutathione lyase
VLDRRDVYEHTGQVAAIVMKALDPRSLAPFWSSATGWDVVESTPGYAALQHQRRRGPLLELIATNEAHRVKNRWHLDVRPDAGGDRDAEVERLLDLGATRVEVGQANASPGEVTWVVLADPEGNEFCVLRAFDQPKAQESSR